jgi:hypothetical protein
MSTCHLSGAIEEAEDTAINPRPNLISWRRYILNEPIFIP